MKFYIGLHIVQHARQFSRCMISINRLRGRKAGFVAREWILDSGAFTEVSQYGRHRTGVERYAFEIIKWSPYGRLVCAVSQDYMCEKIVLDKTGLTVKQHQRLTVDRYRKLRPLVPDSIHILPVLQGYEPKEYVKHITMYGNLLKPCMWVGVGSVCKRNSNVGSVEAVFREIRQERPDLFLHGFGLKTTAISSPFVRSCIATADSMAWSAAARKEGRDANSIYEAKAFNRRIESLI